MTEKASSQQRPRGDYGLEDAEELAAYLQSGGVVTGCMASNFAVMCQLAGLYKVTEIDCPRCKRKRKRPPPGPRPGGAAAAFWEECGITPEQLRDLVGSASKPPSPCKRCGDTGRVVVRITRGMLESKAITRWPTGSSKHGRLPRSVGESQRARDMGSIGNRLAALRDHDPTGAIAVQLFWGPDGNSLVPLWGLTEPGQKLLVYRNGSKQTPVQFFEAEARRRSQGDTDHVRDRLCDRANDAADQILVAAVRVWNALAPGKPSDATKRSAKREAHERVAELEREAS